jgi:two-component system, NtrC family, sensor kinase
MNNIVIRCILIFTLVYGTCYTQGQNLRMADSLLRIYHTKNDKSELDKLDLLYQIARNHTNSDTILLYSNKLIELSKQNKDDILMLRGYYYRGLGYNNIGNYPKALEAFFSSTEIAKSINCNACIAATFIAIGDVYSQSLNRKNAIIYYNKAIHIATQEKDTNTLASAFLNAGSEYLILNNLDSAFFYFTTAKKIFKQLKNKIGIAYCMGNIGQVQSRKSDYNHAEKNIAIAVSILEEYNDSYALSIYYYYLAEIYKNRKDIIPALNFAQISLNTALNANLLPQVRDAYKILTELHAINGDLDKAFECQSNYIATRDSINNEATIRKMADLRTEYEIAQKQTEVDLLKKKRLTQRIIVYGLFIVLALTLGIFAVHYSNTRKRRLLNKRLIERQKTLQKQHDQLEKLNKTKDRFFSIISHDLRGPISVLNGTTLLIRDFLDSKNYEELDELTANMEYSVKKVLNLLDNLLEWAVSQQGEFPYKPEKLRMEDICNNVLNIFITMAATKSIVLTYEIKPDAKIVVADMNSLMTILRNLVSNALKFTNKGGSVNILAERKKDEYCISVSDTGIGMPESKQQDVFKLSENKSTWGTDKEKGLGIGLSLVHEFVKMNKGNIKVESAENVGTTFSICLPQGKLANQTPTIQEEKYSKNVS